MFFTHFELGYLTSYNILTSPNEADELASHVLVLFVRGLASDLKFALANFGTSGVTSYQLVPIFWRAVCLLELTCNLWVCVACCDGASQTENFSDSIMAWQETPTRTWCIELSICMHHIDSFTSFPMLHI